MATFAIHPLSDALTFGARVTGVTIALLKDSDIRAQLQQLFEDRGVIVFEGVENSSAMQTEISEVFGPLKEHPVPQVDRADADNLKGVIAISAGEHAAIVEIDGKPLVTWQPWHFDHAYNDEINRAGVLRPVIIASEGGKTGFACGIQIYNDMDPAIRARMEGLYLHYNLDLRYTHQQFGLPKNFRQTRYHDSKLHEETAGNPCSIHPAMWQRATGEKVFHMTGYGCRGVNGDKSDSVFPPLEEIWDEAMRVIKPYYHDWQPNDMVIWDNWRVLHEATGCPPGIERIVHRTTIKGDYGLGRFEQPHEMAQQA